MIDVKLDEFKAALIDVRNATNATELKAAMDKFIGAITNAEFVVMGALAANDEKATAYDKIAQAASLVVDEFEGKGVVKWQNSQLKRAERQVDRLKRSVSKMRSGAFS